MVSAVLGANLNTFDLTANLNVTGSMVIVCDPLIVVRALVSAN